MDTSRIKLDYVVENREYVTNLGAALDTTSVTVKKQVFELLTALCAYNADGHARALETLEHYKEIKGTRYRLKLVITELEQSSASHEEYHLALLTFVNSLIHSAGGLQDKIRLRNEFIGLNLIPVLSNLRRATPSSAKGVLRQLDVFDERRENDESQSLQSPEGINLNSHLDVFYAILRQVAGTPHELPFISILQHLLRIDCKEHISDTIWETAEKLVHRATLLDKADESPRLLRQTSVQHFTCQACRGEAPAPIRRQSLAQSGSPLSPTASAAHIPAPPPTPSKPSIPPPPPPPLMPGGAPAPPPPAPPGPPAPPAPPAPPPFQGATAGAASSGNASHSPVPPRPSPLELNTMLLPQQTTPKPTTKMRTYNWNQIPLNQVVGKRNIWTMVAASHQDSPKVDMDWSQLEKLFCQTINPVSPIMGRRRDAVDSPDRKQRKENQEIILLDGKRTLNINIFLKQFRNRTSNTTNPQTEIIQLIRDGDHGKIGVEKLRGFLKILPEVHELDMLTKFDGDATRLGDAEKFLMQLIQVSNYTLRIESMLIKEEFSGNVDYLESCINAVLYAGEDLTSNALLREVLYFVIVTGNFLNAGGYAGKAVGVKLSSLQKLTDIRANVPDMNLLHYVVLQTEKKNPDLLRFPDTLTTLEEASKTNIEQINNEVNVLNGRVKRITKQVELPGTDDDIKTQMTGFLLNAESKLKELGLALVEVETLRLQLAEFFCEDPGTFQLEECFKIFQNFCSKFKAAVTENERRRVLDEQKSVREKQQLEKKARQVSSQAGTPVSDSDTSQMLDSITFDIRMSPSMPRHRMGSFTSNGDRTESPEHTPNGTLRRRSSREDDAKLFKLLNESGYGESRERRQPYIGGSLDRSWCRKGARTRPHLYDFNAERERPSSPSPSPLSESKPLPGDDSKPREVHQKVKSWLANTETEDVSATVDHRRTSNRYANNRKSFEKESDTERSKLDPLPEERSPPNVIVKSPTDSYSRVYPDWKPTDRHTASTHDLSDSSNSAATSPQAPNRYAPTDTSSEGKSSPEHDIYSRRLTRNRSRELPSSNLQSIIEEDRRKNVIKQLGERPASDRLQLYIRRPSDVPEPTDPLNEPIDHSKTPIRSSLDRLLSPSSPIPPSRNRTPTTASIPSKEKLDFTEELSTRKKSSNPSSPTLKVPPKSTPCRKLQTPRPLHRKTIEDNARHEGASTDNVSLDQIDPGDGHFDRHSTARRTVRIRRPADTTDDTIQTKSNTKVPGDTNTSPKTKDPSSERWTAHPNSPTEASPTHEPTKQRVIARMGIVGRKLSSINPEDVREAKRNLKSPAETPERIWSPPREIIKQTPATKTSQHELNDEGFEETQSLVSDTPSHGKESESSCNETTSTPPTIRTPSSDSTVTTASELSKKKSTATTPTGSRASPSSRLFDTSARATTLKRPTSVLLNSPMTIRRTASMRNAPSSRTSSYPAPAPVPATAINKQPAANADVERSGSRTSLRSSRSSLNSGVSAVTVKNMAAQKSVLEKSLYKKPQSGAGHFRSSTAPSYLPPSTAPKTTSRAPASRSSSSGSSIGASVNGVRRPVVTAKAKPSAPVGTAASLSRFREPITSSVTIKYSPSAATRTLPANSVSGANNNSTKSNTAAAKLTTRHASPASGTTSVVGLKTSHSSNFMRPTAASSVKGAKGK